MMIFKEKKTIHEILISLFETYSRRVPDVKKITNALINKNVISNQFDIINDHIAFRTMGVNHLGIKSFEKIFLHHGYERRDFYSFEKKKLNAYWYSHQEINMPRIFISELIVDELSKKTQKIIHKYTNQVKSDPVDDIDLNDSKQVIRFLSSPLWNLPTIQDYEFLLSESEYASWVIYNRYYLNHYTISVHELNESFNTLEKFNKLVIKIGIKLNDSGGVIKKSKDGLLLQSSSIANKIKAIFANNKKKLISGSYVEFAERRVLPEFKTLKKELIKPKHRRDGFETSNADRIFESTFTKQVDHS